MKTGGVSTPTRTPEQSSRGERPPGPGSVPVRGRYLTLQQAADSYPIFSLRFLRRLVQERRIPFSRVGRCIVIAERDIEAYLERNRVEPPRWETAS